MYGQALGIKEGVELDRAGKTVYETECGGFMGRVKQLGDRFFWTLWEYHQRGAVLIGVPVRASRLWYDCWTGAAKGMLNAMIEAE